MIITLLKGGLGNQMFQYAMARRLALRHGTVLALDLRSLLAPAPGDSVRPFELDQFHVVAQLAAESDAVELSGRYKGNLQRYLTGVRRMTGRARFRVNCYSERSFQFSPEVLLLPSDTYLDGFWQSERYFADVESHIRQEFRLRHPPGEESKKAAEKIKRVEAVSLHVRRGDFITNPSAANFHGSCSLDYYRLAVEIVTGCIASPHFFVFSDDLDWAQRELQLSHPHSFVDHNGPDAAHEDLWLMSLCKHNIIANSSFSWWGAWLNQNDRKVVIAPRNWFRNPDIDTSDLIPSSWIRI